MFDRNIRFRNIEISNTDDFKSIIFEDHLISEKAMKIDLTIFNEEFEQLKDPNCIPSSVNDVALKTLGCDLTSKEGREKLRRCVPVLP